MLEAGAVSPRELLSRAAAIYDSPANGLAISASRAAWGGFASGAMWMRRAMEAIRGEPIGVKLVDAPFQLMGFLKYAAALVAAAVVAFAAFWIGIPWLAVSAVLVFYAVEAQAVFLFPLVIDGCERPFREARRWTVRAGGTFKVMSVVMPIAATMLIGGFVGRGFVRSWCLGCLAVCLWYERIRRRTAPAAAA